MYDNTSCFNQENVDKFSRLAKQGEEAAKAKASILPQLGEDALRSIWKAEVSKKLGEVTGQNEEWLKKLKEKGISKQFKSVMAGSDKGVRSGNILSTSMFPKNIAKRIYLWYANKGDTVWDPCAGHNSRMEACFETQRNYIGYDVSKEYMKINEQVKQRLLNNYFVSPDNKLPTIELYLKDSRECDLPDASIDLVFTSPPYWDIEFYGDEAEQLGNANTYKGFLHELEIILAQAYRVLKSEKFCIINVNDFRKDSTFYAYHADVIALALHVGFEMHDIIIMQYPSSVRLSFPIQLYEAKETAKVHEYLLIFKKPIKYYNYIPEILRKAEPFIEKVITVINEANQGDTIIADEKQNIVFNATQHEPDSFGALKTTITAATKKGELDKETWKAPADRQANLFEHLHDIKKSHRTALMGDNQTRFTEEAEAVPMKPTGFWSVQCVDCGLDKGYASEEEASIIRLMHKNGNHSKS